jgi:hypothetical protein
MFIIMVVIAFLLSDLVNLFMTGSWTLVAFEWVHGKILSTKRPQLMTFVSVERQWLPFPDGRDDRRPRNPFPPVNPTGRGRAPNAQDTDDVMEGVRQ